MLGSSRSRLRISLRKLGCCDAPPLFLELPGSKTVGKSKRVHSRQIRKTFTQRRDHAISLSHMHTPSLRRSEQTAGMCATLLTQGCLCWCWMQTNSRLFTRRPPPSAAPLRRSCRPQMPSSVNAARRSRTHGKYATCVAAITC